MQLVGLCKRVAASVAIVASLAACADGANGPSSAGRVRVVAATNVWGDIAAQIGDIEKAIRYGMAALLMDLADVGGNVKDGCHIASMGGTWMMLTFGFGGLRDNDGKL